ncbi:hypothetical protein KAX97_14020 [candidate division WOR-3 bacterium]|nr:hypothetical protein [candidate division WOR-3 bacterium]
MKKLLTCLIIMLLVGGILQIAVQNSSIKQDAPVIGAMINAMSPGVMYADDPGTPPPPPDTGPQSPPQPFPD